MTWLAMAIYRKELTALACELKLYFTGSQPSKMPYELAFNPIETDTFLLRSVE
jgi:hypothetical protein